MGKIKNILEIIISILQDNFEFKNFEILQEEAKNIGNKWLNSSQIDYYDEEKLKSFILHYYSKDEEVTHNENSI